MDEQGRPDKIQILKRSIQWKAGSDDPGGIQRHCLSVQLWGRKAKAHLDMNLVRDMKANKKVF